MVNTATYIAERLYKEGVRHVFGIPGGPSIPYIEAFRKAGIEFILTANESSAGIMADVTARLTGITGVCHATFGPGATNISTGTGEALLDRSPVIVFTSEMDDRMTGRTAQMNIDHQKLFAPLTKKTFRINPAYAADLLEEALRLCREEYPGPVHIGLPSDIAEKEIEAPGRLSGEPRPVKKVNNETGEIARLLAGARRPLLAAGLTANRTGIKTRILEFLEKYRMPVVLTPMARDLIPHDHPSYAGVLFHALSDYLGDLFEKTDLVIGLGYDPVEYNYESWLPEVPLIHLNTVVTDLPERDNIFSFTGPPAEWFRILSELNEGTLAFEQGLVQGIRDEMASVLNGFTGHFGPVLALKVLNRELPADAIVTADVGSHLHLAGQMWRTGNGGSFMMTNGWSGMGFGIPAALAAKIARPQTVAACITGDGGFLMQAGEMVTARRYNLPVITVVMSDGELNLIKLKQTWKNAEPSATSLYQGDLFGAGSFLGCRVFTADSEETMTAAVRRALMLDSPSIINAFIDPEDYKWLIVKQ